MKPEIGQRWRDNDPRCNKVRELLLLKTTMKGEHEAFECNVYENGLQTKSVTIRASRFKPTHTGYRYVGEGAP